VRTTFFYVKNGARTHLKTARFCHDNITQVGFSEKMDRIRRE
jgi:hypothetical protein